MPITPIDIATVRQFNRAYTRQIGLLSDGWLESSFSLAEVRVLYELAYRDGPTASALCADLGLDRGYLSRILATLRRRELVAAERAPHDGRQAILSLTPKGRRAFAPLDRAADAQVRNLLSGIVPSARSAMLDGMRSIERAFAPNAANQTGEPSFSLRPHRSGDLGWVVQRHGELYWNEYRYDLRFEALVAKIVGEFVERFDSARERCWIAERNGERVGSVFCVMQSRTVAKLRLLLVEPSARGHGIGASLVRECVDFTRAAGYKKLVRWTQKELVPARKLYSAAGFVRTSSSSHSNFGVKSVAENYELVF